ncbi:MAG: FAD-dependent thymidylate synthase, partial [Clostridia bacterium]|nr:FAD-dependent thymidylate synthase [Clostridia bacterium]
EKTAEKNAKKKAQEDARYVLSNACDTKIVMTMNVRSLYNFFSLRTCSRAQWEIRELATEMLRLVKGVSPILFKNAGPSCVKGGCKEGAMTCGKAKEMRDFFKNM